MEHPYPDHAFLDRDADTNEKRWFSTKGMGVQYVHEDRAAEDIAAAVAAERARLQEPTEEMLIAARDWSLKKYGKPIGNDAARGCWAAMLAASKQEG